MKGSEICQRKVMRYANMKDNEICQQKIKRHANEQ
jgi:hypothetical protein